MNAQGIGALMTRLRKEQGLTQAQLAQRVGVTNKAVSKWETGAGMPDITVLPTLARVLNTTADALLRGTIAPDAKPTALWNLPYNATMRALLCVMLVQIQGKKKRLPLTIVQVAVVAALFLFSLVLVACCNFSIGYALVAATCTAVLADILWFGVLAAALGAVRAKLLWGNGKTLPQLCVCDSGLYTQNAGVDFFYAYSAVQTLHVFKTCLVLAIGEQTYVVMRPDAQTTQALIEHLKLNAPEVRVLRTHKKAGRLAAAIICALCALVFSGACTLRTQGFLASVSESGNVAVVRVDPKTGGAAWYRNLGTQKETFAYAVAADTVPQFDWLTNDACAVTYVAKMDGMAHQSVITFGSRAPASYYYVFNALQAHWAAQDGETQLWVDKVGLRIWYKDKIYTYKFTDCVQFGNLAIVACAADVPQFTVVLGTDFVFADDAGGTAGGGSIAVCPVLMQKTQPVTLLYQKETV